MKIRFSTDVLWRATGAIMRQVWKYEERRAPHAPASAQPPAVAAPPNYTIWIQTMDPDSPHLVDKAQTLTEAIGRAVRLLARKDAPYLVLETATGDGWAIEAVRNPKR